MKEYSKKERKEISQRIVNLMKSREIKAKDLINMMGISKSGVSSWTTGRNIPDGTNMSRLVDILQTTPQYILTGQDIGQEIADSLMNKSLIRRAIIIARQAELMGGYLLDPEELSDRVVEIYFRIEHNLGIDGMLESSKTNKDLMRNASIEALDTLDWVSTRPGIDLNKDEREELYSDMLEAAQKAILVDQRLDREKWLEKVTTSK